MSRRVDSQDYATFKVNFYRSGESQYLRLGQAFINAFFPLESADGDRIVDRDPSLFYETSDSTAEQMIFERYVK